MPMGVRKTGAGEKNTPQHRKAFLEALAAGKVPAVACKEADLGYTTVHQWRRDDEEFARAWDDAAEHGIDLLEQEARRRAYEGVDRPVYQGGEMVGVVREYSDTLMTVLLKGRRKRVFSERIEHGGADGAAAIEHHMEVTFVSSKSGGQK